MISELVYTRIQVLLNTSCTTSAASRSGLAETMVVCGKEAKAKKEAGEDVKAFLAEKEQEYRTCLKGGFCSEG